MSYGIEQRHGARRAMGVSAVAGCLLYAVFAIAATATDTECTDAWADAPANAYCPAEGTAAMAVPDTNKCIVGASSCSITVDVTDGAGTTTSETFNATFPRAWTLVTGGVSLADTDDIDICIGTSSSGGFVATVRTACGSTEVTSEKATASGLSTSG